jgi:Tol biopolymer transport system component
VRLAYALALATACRFAPASVTGSGSDGGDGGVDGDAVQPDCVAAWLAGSVHFAPAEQLGTLDEAGFERDPFFYPDEHTVYFSSSRAGSTGGADVYTATRTSLTDSFGAATPFVPANSLGYDGRLAFTPDGTFMVISSDRTGGQGMHDDIWMSIHTAAGYPPMNQVHLMMVNTDDYQEDPMLSDDGLDLYEAPNAAIQHIAMSSRTSTGADFKAPKVIGELDSGQGDADPFIAYGERLIVFSSSRGSGTADANLYYATRTDPTKPFDPPHLIAELSTGANEGDPFLATDGCHLYFASDARGAGYTLFVAAVLR